MKVVTAIDDLAALKGEKIEANHTVRFTLQIDDGPVRAGALDLCDANTADVTEQMEPLFAAVPIEAPRARQPRRDTPLARAKAERGGMKDWVDYHRIRARSGRDRPAYETPGGQTYWPRWVEKMYAEALNGRGRFPIPPEGE